MHRGLPFFRGGNLYFWKQICVLPSVKPVRRFIRRTIDPSLGLALGDRWLGQISKLKSDSNGLIFLGISDNPLSPFTRRSLGGKSRSRRERNASLARDYFPLTHWARSGYACKGREPYLPARWYQNAQSSASLVLGSYLSCSEMHQYPGSAASVERVKQYAG